MIKSHQIGSSKNATNFENIENLLKLIVGKICDK